MGRHRQGNGMEGLCRALRKLRTPAETGAASHMSHQAIDAQLTLRLDPHRNPVLSRLERGMLALNQLIVIPCMVAMVAAACVLTYSVVTRYFLKMSTDWQDE